MTDKSDNDIPEQEPIPALDNTAWPTIDVSSLSFPSFSYTTTPTVTSGSSGSYFYTTAGANGTASSYNWTNGATGSMGSSGLHVKSDAEFEGDIKWKGRSLGKLLEKIEDRLAILQEPDPAKLEKYAALKKAYDQYKLLEKLIGEE